MLSGDYYKREEPLFAVDLARKDARHAQSIANKAGVTMNVRTHSQPKSKRSSDFAMPSQVSALATLQQIATIICFVQHC